MSFSVLLDSKSASCCSSKWHLVRVLTLMAVLSRFTGHYPLHSPSSFALFTCSRVLCLIYQCSLCIFAPAVTIVGYAFKSPRYSSIHLPSVRWPATKFKYVGIDNEGRERIQGDVEGEVSPFFLAVKRRPILIFPILIFGLCRGLED